MAEGRRLDEIAAQIRSKNAGPFWVTLDVFFESEQDLRAVVESGALTEQTIAELYHVDRDDVRIFALPAIYALKISFPRATIAGSFEDSDMHAGQQHVPLAQVTIPMPAVDG